VSLPELELEISSSGDESIKNLTAYAKLIAMTVQGIEEAIGEQYVGAFITLLSKKLINFLNPPTSSIAKLLEWFNTNTALRLNTYRVKGRLVRKEEQGLAFYLVAYECPIRQILYLEDLPGGKALCKIICRILSTLLSKASGGRVEVEPSRMGPNACLLRAGIEEKIIDKVEGIDVTSSPPSVDEYKKLVLNFYSILLKGIGWALYTVLGGNPAMSYRVGKSYGKLTGYSILAEGYEASSLEEAVDLLNTSLRDIINVELDRDTIIVKRNVFRDIVEKEGIEHPEFIDRIVQGFIAGILGALIGAEIDLRYLRENTFKVMSK
jgi:predicted hydrocarbon binding protein